jgi:hypothetical protein
MKCGHLLGFNRFGNSAGSPDVMLSQFPSHYTVSSFSYLF